MILGDVDVGLRAEHRYVIPDWALADHYSGRVHPRVPRQVFERLCGVEEVVGLFVLLVGGLEAGLLFECRADRYALPLNRLRNHRCNQTGLGRGHAHHSTDVPHDAPALQLMERRDLPDARLPVLVTHVLNDTVALVHAEVDVEVGHRYAFGVQEPLEQQSVRDGVQVGDAKRPRDERPRTRAAARPHGDAVILRPVDEVLDDEEVTGEAHLENHLELELEAGVVDVLLKRLAPLSHLLDAPTEPRDRKRAQVVFFAGATGHREARKLWRGKWGRLTRTHLRDAKRIFRGVGHVGEEAHHLLRRLEIQLGGVMVHGFHLSHASTCTDALQYELSMGGLALEVVAVVGADEGERELVCETSEDLVERTVLREAMVLELDEEVSRLEAVTKVRESVAADFRTLVEDLLSDVAAHAGAEPDHPLAVLVKDLEVDSGLIVCRHTIDPAAAHHPYEVLVAFLRRGEQQEMVKLFVLRVPTIARREVHFAA